MPAVREGSDEAVMAVHKALVNIVVSVSYTGSIEIVFEHWQVNHVSQSFVG